MAAWRLALSLEQLRNELNFLWPGRDHSSDGSIGDAAHAATASDHNPNSAGVVCAYDIDTDLDGTDDSNDPEMDRLVAWMRAHPHPDLKYVIYRGRMFSTYARAPYAPLEWRPYGGADPHVSHAHVSVGQGSDGHSAPGTYDDMTAWLTGFLNPDPTLVHPPAPLQEDDSLRYVMVIHVKDGGNIKDGYQPVDPRVWAANPAADPIHIDRGLDDVRNVLGSCGHELVADGNPNYLLNIDFGGGLGEHAVWPVDNAGAVKFRLPTAKP